MLQALCFLLSVYSCSAFKGWRYHCGKFHALRSSSGIRIILRFLISSPVTPSPFTFPSAFQARTEDESFGWLRGLPGTSCWKTGANRRLWYAFFDETTISKRKSIWQILRSQAVLSAASDLKVRYLSTNGADSPCASLFQGLYKLTFVAVAVFILGWCRSWRVGSQARTFRAAGRIN
jgi:hypothetical protein